MVQIRFLLVTVLLAVSCSVRNGLSEEDFSHRYHGGDDERSGLIHESSSSVPTPASLIKDEQANQSSDDVAGVKLVNTSPLVAIDNPHKTKYPIKYCADLRPIKELFSNHVEPYYLPLVELLPQEFQHVLLDETPVAGLSLVSCVFVSLCAGFLLTIWFLMTRMNEKSKTLLNVNLNEQLLALKLSLKELGLKNQTFENEINEMDVKLTHSESVARESEAKLTETQEKYQRLLGSSDLSTKEAEKLKTSELKLSKELNQLKLEFNDLSERFQRQKSDYEEELTRTRDSYERQLSDVNEKLNTARESIEQLSGELSRVGDSEQNLRSQLEAKEKELVLVQNALLKTSVHSDTIDPEASRKIMDIAQLYMEIKSLEERLNEANRQSEKKDGEYVMLKVQIDEKDKAVENAEAKQKEMEKQLKENEMQIKLLNELREKDTKQHIKALSELDAQLKKKSSDADKIVHLLDQIRVKQERIQELESQYAKIEKQSTQERQTFEKQAHENWLSARKLERELKDTKNELVNLKEKFTELDTGYKSVLSENTALKQNFYNMNKQQQQYFQNYTSPQNGHQTVKKSNQDSSTSSSPKPTADEGSSSPVNGGDMSLNESKIDRIDPLQIDTTSQGDNSRPPSVSSSHSGSGYSIRPPLLPYRYPFPIAPMNPYMAQASPGAQIYSPNHHQLMYKMMMQQHQQMLQQQQQQQQQASKSTNSSQQPSPGVQVQANNQNSHIPYSASFPNANSTSLLNGKHFFYLIVD